MKTFDIFKALARKNDLSQGKSIMKGRQPRLEELEERQLLSVTTAFRDRETDILSLIHI